MMKFGEWLPDQPSFENRGVTEAKNVVPALDGYRSLKTLAAISGAATNDIIGMFSGKDDQHQEEYYGDI